MYRRLLFTALSALSLLVCVVTLALWMRSYWVNDSFDWGRPTVRHSIGSNRGNIWWDRIDITKSPQASFSRGTGYDRHPAGAFNDTFPPTWSFAGFAWRHAVFSLTPGSGAVDTRNLRVPDWSIALAMLVLPGLWLMTRRLRNRRADGLCRRCGYDLRATPGRCPECGTETQMAGSA
jgi:hypothetical protein